MAIFHYTVKIVGRSKGKSIISASAYLNGDVMKNEETGRISYYTSKREVVYTSLMMCENAPQEWQNVPAENIKRFQKSVRYKRADNKEVVLEKFKLTFQKQCLCVNLENVGRVEELLAMTEQMQDELDQKDQTILELNRQLNRSLTLNEKLNSENRAENIEALRTKLKQTEEQLTSETDSRKRADAEVVAWKFKYEKAEQAKRYAQTHQKTVEVPVEKKVPYEKCDNCDRTAYQKAKEKCDSRKIQLEKKYKQMTTGYESLMFLLAWYSIATTLFTAILSPVFLNDCITFFGTIGKGIINLFREFVTGADSFGQLSNGISNSIVSGIVYWLIAAIVMGILFIITGFLIIGIGYQVGKIYRKYCWDIISIMVAIMSTAIVIYFGEWIKSVIPINLIVLLLLVYVVYIGIRCYVKDWREERGYY